MDFQKSYNRQDFLRFLRNDFLKEQFSEQIEETDLAKKINSRFFSKITKLWTALDLDNLIVLEIEHKSKNDARIALTKDIFKLLRQYELEWIIRQHALVILTNPDSPDQYRLSLLTTTYNDKFEEKLSNPKRFSYLLWVWEKVKTANDFLFEKWNIKDFNDLENRFKVEVVRENFFNDYLNLYIRLYKSIVEAKDFHELLLKNNVDVVSFTKNLLWKIVFLYFIQKKWWFKNKETWIWDNLFFKNIWDDFNNKWEKNSIEKKNYFYNDYLEYIFYEWLNIEDRNNDFSKKFWWEIPYLNWWLFKEDYPNWKNNIAKIANEIFSNEKETWILDIFNLYNFTIDEDDLYDKEVAIDPEMLWKIFEKMISVDSKNIWKIVETYNEKSSKKRGEFITMDIENWNVWNNNKKLWAFYTPREIVHYMTKESLINYLINNLDWKKEDKEKKVRDLFDFKDKYLTDNDLSIEKIKNDFENVLSIVLDVNKKLKEVKILDPAIGSGAFPMWILHEISTLRYYIYDVLIKNVLWQKDYKNSMYDIKKEIIENNIYWVDIEPGAIDIARLRFWLSLIVDEETPEPLPNFEFKFVCANTLLPIEKEEKQLDMEWYIKDEAKLETLKKYKWEYFNISDKEKKEALKNRIRNYTALNNQQEFWYIPSKRAVQFNEFWNNFDNSKHSHSFFDPSLMMSEWRGFDIVIWNPPYIWEKWNSDLFTIYKENALWSNFMKKRANLYYLFLIYGLNLLKLNWIITYIIPNDLLTSDYSEHIREYLSKNSNVNLIFDFNKNQVFEWVWTNAMIIWYWNKINNNWMLNFRQYSNFQWFRKNILLEEYNSNIFKNSILESKYWNFINDKNTTDIVNIDYYWLTTQVWIQTWCNDVSWKLYNKVIGNYTDFLNSYWLWIYVLENDIDIKKDWESFFINNSINSSKKEWKKLNDLEISYIKPIFTWNIIKKWIVGESNKYVIWLNKENFNNSLINKIPNLIEHLENYKIFLINRNAKKFISIDEFNNTIDKTKLYNKDWDTQSTLWKWDYYLLQKYAYWLDFEANKIAWQSRWEVNFYFSTNTFYWLSSINFIYLKYIPEYLNIFNSNQILMFISWLLNSNLFKKYYEGNNNTWTKIKNIPIIKINKDNDFQVKKVIEIIEIVKKLHNWNDIITNEKELDRIVYELYWLEK